MDLSLKNLLLSTEEDLATLNLANFSENNKEMLITGLKRSACSRFINKAEEMISTLKKSTDIDAAYDLIKNNFFDINIHKVIVADATLHLNKKQYKSKREKIINHMRSLGAFLSEDHDQPKLLKTSSIARDLGFEEKYVINTMSMLKKNKIVENMPHQGWYLNDVR